MTFPRTKFGFAVDPVGEYVRLDHQGRILLGEVTEIYLREFPYPCTMARVKHFNGEPWPIEPGVTSLQWIKQDSE